MPPAEPTPASAEAPVLGCIDLGLAQLDAEVAGLPEDEILAALRALFVEVERAWGFSERHIASRLRLIAADGEEIERRLLRWYIVLDHLGLPAQGPRT